MRAAAASRAVLVGGRPKFLRELPRPFYSAHHIGGTAGYGPYPDNAIESMDYLLADGETVMNYTSTNATSDGTIVVIHDSTVDRTLNGTGAVASMTLATFKALRVATLKGGWPGFPDNVWPTRTFDEGVAYLGARGVHKPEAYPVTGTAATVLASYTSRGLVDYVQIDTGNLTNLAAFRAAGFSTSYIVPDGTTVAALQSAWPASNGAVQINYYQASPPGGSIAAYIQALITAGYTLQVFQMNRKSDCADAIAAAAAVGGVLDGIISNDPVYHNLNIWKARTSDSFATGRWPHGFVAGGGGGVPRAFFYPGARVGWNNHDAPGSASYMLEGELSPLNRPFTLTYKAIVEGLSSLASTTIAGAVCTTDRSYANATGASRLDGYYWSYNITSGLMSLFKNSGGGTTQSTLGSKASAAPAMPLKLTADLTSGVAITALPVRAVPASIPTGTRFIIPVGTDVLEVTTSGVTAANATSVPITSATPTALVPALTRIPQQIQFSLQLTSTQVILKRLDTGDTLTVTDSTYGAALFPFFGKQANGTTITFADGVTTSGSPVVTSASLAAFVLSTDEDKVITHANLPTGTQVLSVDSATQVTLTANATASGSGLTMTLYRSQNAVTYRSITVGP